MRKFILGFVLAVISWAHVTSVLAEAVPVAPAKVMFYVTDAGIGRGPSEGPLGATGPRDAFQDELRANDISFTIVGGKSEGVATATYSPIYEGLEGPSFRLPFVISTIGGVMTQYRPDVVVIPDLLLWEAFFEVPVPTMVTGVVDVMNLIHLALPETQVIFGNSWGTILGDRRHPILNSALALAVKDLSWVTLVNQYIFTSASFMSTFLLREEDYNLLGSNLAHAAMPFLQPAPVPVPSAVWLLGSALVAAVMMRRCTNA